MKMTSVQKAHRDLHVKSPKIPKRILFVMMEPIIGLLVITGHYYQSEIITNFAIVATVCWVITQTLFGLLMLASAIMVTHLDNKIDGTTPSSNEEKEKAIGQIDKITLSFIKNENFENSFFWAFGWISGIFLIASFIYIGWIKTAIFTFVVAELMIRSIVCVTAEIGKSRLDVIQKEYEEEHDGKSELPEQKDLTEMSQEPDESRHIMLD